MARSNPGAPSVWLVGAVLLVTALAVPAIATTGTHADGPSEPDGATGADQTGTTCEYDRLYDDAVGSVVLVDAPAGGGSGFVYASGDGEGSNYVLTNQHVVGEAATVLVQFRDDEYREADVVGRDAFADLAVLRVDRTPEYADALPIAEDPPDPGQEVVAIGSPFGLEGTVTHGIVSGVNRSMPTDRGYAVPDVVQTDAPVNPGNSGGPLLDCDGAVVGVNTAGIQAAFAENVGFAISQSLVHRVAPTLIEEGEVEWPYLGVGTVDVTPAVADERGLERARGIVVVETLEDGPAADVLRPADDVRSVEGQPVPSGGDVVLAIDGRRVDTGEDLSSYLATETAVGDTVTLGIVRDGERLEVNVTLEARPADDPATG